MKNNILYLILILGLLVVGCDMKLENPEALPLEFKTELTQITHNSAKVRVTHSGDTDVTWHYFYCTAKEWKTDKDIFKNEYYALIKSGDFKDKLKKTNDRSILIESLDEDTEYIFVVFGVREDGELYDTPMASVSFATPSNIYTLKDVTKNETWKISYKRNNKQEEVISVTSKREVGYFDCTVIPKEKIDQWEKENPDGFEMYDNDILMYTLKNGIEMYVMQSIYDIQDQLSSGYAISAIATQNSLTAKELKMPRIQSGEHYIIITGFSKNGQHTQEYTYLKININEDLSASEEYLKWCGTYELSGMAELRTDDNTQIEKEVKYTLNIEGIDNNFMYRITGWECGEDIKEENKWSDEIASEGFKAYFKDGKLEIRESYVTSLTIEGTKHELGIYGYGFNKIYNREMPVFYEDNPMATADPIKEGEDVTYLQPKTFEYYYYDANMSIQKDNAKYTKMGFMAINTKDYSYKSKNPPLNLPLKLKKISE